MSQVSGIRTEVGQGGLQRIVVETDLCRGELYLQGAHVTQYQPAGQRPVLWLSGSSYFEPGKPIRGGVPLCFPWFGPHPTRSDAPAHGTARIQVWDVVAFREGSNGSVGVELATTIDDYQLTYQADFGSTLKLSFRIDLSLHASQSRQFEEALHSYFAVGHIRATQVEGLEHSSYLDKMASGALMPPAGVPHRFDRETDRVYIDTRETCCIRDEQLQRVITIQKIGSRSTVLWNPWVDKSARMPDFGNDEWTDMLCIESANVGPNQVTLEPGDSHYLGVEIAVA